MKCGWLNALCSIAIAFVVGCGSDAPQDADSGGTGGASGAAAGSGGGVPCGALRCQAPENYSGAVCCRDAFTATCGGQTSQDTCTAFPKVIEPNCPDGTIVQSIGAMFVRGCCLEGTNDCGLDLSSGLAIAGSTGYCSPLDSAAIFDGSGVEGVTVVATIPPATHCDGTPAE